MSLMGEKLAMAEVIAFISSVYLMIQAMDDVKKGYKKKLEKEAKDGAAEKEGDSRKAVLAEEVAECRRRSSVCHRQHRPTPAARGTADDQSLCVRYSPSHTKR